MLGRTAALRSTTCPSVTTFANSSYSPAQFANPTVSRHKLRAAQVVDAATARSGGAVPRGVRAGGDRTWRVACASAADRIVVVPRARRRDVLGEPTPERRRDGPAAARASATTSRSSSPSPGTSTTRVSTCSSRGRGCAPPDRPELVVLVAGRPGRAHGRR